ncbi:site-specific integrase [Jonquetella anthropi]|uniref:site-specific integrase n=1 Tax=Jonquetella anthropi TaxID=428712 RepID=UPI0001B911F2|nr:site-specific integrase [Jonquetella anthropi]EEX47854.1 site-specific recombinase, phage integrase family [Jonquetella anthropi E3_33 E1]
MRIKLTQNLVSKPPDDLIGSEIFDTATTGFMLRIGKHARTFYAVYRGKTRQLRKFKIGSATYLTLAQARDICKSVLGRIALGQDPQEERLAEKTNTISLRKFFEEIYFPKIRRERPKTAQRTETNFLRILKEDLSKPLASISAERIIKIREQLLRRGLGLTSVKRYENEIRASLNYAASQGLIEPIKVCEQIKCETTQRIRYLTPDEEERLQKALKERDEELRKTHKNIRGRYADYLEPLITLSLKTGIRRGAMLRLEWRDIDFAAKTILVRGEICKTGKSRRIPLSPIAFETLKAWREQQPQENKYVFPSAYTNQPKKHCKCAWKNLLIRANITNFHWHDLRHDFASKLVMAGVDLNTVRELLGHSTLEMTLRYAHLAPSKLSAAIETLG